MTSIERVTRQLNHQSVDRIACSEQFWNFTLKNWVDQGKMAENTKAVDEFGLDIESVWPFKCQLDYKKADEVIDEDEDTITYLDGNGATLRRHKKHASTPEHVNYSIKEKSDWDARKEMLVAEEGRIDFKTYRDTKASAKAADRFFLWEGVNVFEQMHPVAGHEHMLMGMALEPEWITDMAETYANLNINLMEILFEKEGKPDGIWFYEDMGFKGHAFMSPEMYQELIMPYHKKTIDFAHSLGLKVIMHSCGFIEPLLPYMIEAGIDCLQAMEVKAGMDLLRIYKNYGDKIALMGGLDVRPIGENNIAGIKRELESKIPFVKANNGFILHSDHSIPESTDYESYKYFVELGLKLGSYC